MSIRINPVSNLGNCTSFSSSSKSAINTMTKNCNGCEHRGTYMCTSSQHCKGHKLYKPRKGVQ